jgi:hypothetical protein
MVTPKPTFISPETPNETAPAIAIKRIAANEVACAR